MGDISYWEKEYSDLLNELEKAVIDLKDDEEQDIESLTNKKEFLETLNKVVQECDTKVARIKEIKKSWLLEFRLIKDKDAKMKYDCKFKDLDAKAKAVIEDFNGAKLMVNKHSLLRAATPTNSVLSGPNSYGAIIGTIIVMLLYNVIKFLML